MKVLFLDFDGVICLSSEWGGRYKKKGFDSNPETPMDIRMDSFNQKAVKVLNEIVEKTGCEFGEFSHETFLTLSKKEKLLFLPNRCLRYPRKIKINLLK